MSQLSQPPWVRPTQRTSTTSLFAPTNTKKQKTETTPFLTVDELVAPVLEEAMNYTYTLPANVYDWNLTLMISLFEKYSPTFMYTINTGLMTSLLPEVVIKNLPSDVLVHHHLCQYVASNITCVNATSDSTQAPTNFCVYPLAPSEYPNPISETPKG